MYMRTRNIAHSNDNDEYGDEKEHSCSLHSTLILASWPTLNNETSMTKSKHAEAEEELEEEVTEVAAVVDGDDDDDDELVTAVASVDDDEEEEVATVKSELTHDDDDHHTTTSKGSPKRGGKRKRASGPTPGSSAKKGRTPAVQGLTIPFRAIKRTMKIDPDIGTVQNEAAIIVTMAAELFIKDLAHHSHQNAKKKGRNTIRYEDVAEARAKDPALTFLEILIP